MMRRGNHWGVLALVTLGVFLVSQVDFSTAGPVKAVRAGAEMSPDQVKVETQMVFANLDNILKKFQAPYFHPDVQTGPRRRRPAEEENILEKKIEEYKKKAALHKIEENEAKSQPKKVVLHKDIEHDSKHRHQLKSPIHMKEGSAAKIEPSVRTICKTPECAMHAKMITESMDRTADPCDDFFQYACGGWIEKNPLSPGVSSVSNFGEAAAVLQERIFLLLDNPAPDPSLESSIKIRDFYNGCKDLDTMDTMGLAPLHNVLDPDGGWPMITADWTEADFSLETAMAHLSQISVFPLIKTAVSLDIFDTSRRLLYLQAGGLLPGHRFPAYKTFMINSAKMLRDDKGDTTTDAEIEQQVQEVHDFETELTGIINEANNAIAGLPIEELYHLTTLQGFQDELDAGAPGQFNAGAYFEALVEGTTVTFNDAEPVVTLMPSYHKDLTTLLASTDKRVIANHVMWWWVNRRGHETTYAMRALVEEYETAILGGTVVVPRDIYCMEEVQFNIGYALARDYADSFFPPEGKTEVQVLVTDIKAAFDDLINLNEWMEPVDLQKARVKLQAIEDFVAYPDWAVDDVLLASYHSGLEIEKDDQFDNLVQIGVWKHNRIFGGLHDIPEATFAYPPTITNAVYSPQENTITILVGILLMPFFAQNSLSAVNYGAIGMVIGHELTHGFDNSGRQFDKDGNFVEWWSQESIDEYNIRAACFVDQYGNYHPPEFGPGSTVTLDGESTLGENIADNGGIREAFLAYQKYVERSGPEGALPGLDEYTSNQLFYLGYANVWCESKTAAAVTSQIASDPHSPGRFRVLGPLTNDENFSNTWGCPVDSAMNGGDDRCVLW